MTELSDGKSQLPQPEPKTFGFVKEVCYWDGFTWRYKPGLGNVFAKITDKGVFPISPIPETPTPEVLQTLAVRWMESFEKAARSQNKAGVMNLFDPSALICGSQKGGPLDQLQSKHFHFEMDAAKMIPHPPCVLVVAQWHAVSDVHGGPTRKGDATFFCGMESYEEDVTAKTSLGKILHRFVCYHAHFSMQ